MFDTDLVGILDGNDVGADLQEVWLQRGTADQKAVDVGAAGKGCAVGASHRAYVAKRRQGICGHQSQI